MSEFNQTIRYVHNMNKFISSAGADFDPYPSYEHALMASKLNQHPDRENLCRQIKGMKVIREVKKLVNTSTAKDVAWWKARYS
jgi:hypothetical protein